MGEATSKTVVVDLEHPVSVPYRPWWPAITLASLASFVLSIGVVFALITSIDRADRSAERTECRARFGATITAAEQAADNAEHRLFVEIVRTLGVPASERSLDPLLDIANEGDRLNQVTNEIVERYGQFLEGGQQMPCPLDEEDL